MSIVSGFARADRFSEVEGCPLAGPARSTIDESACAQCPYNALKPGAARIGCVLHTPYRAYQKLMAQVAARPEEGARLLEVCAAQGAEGVAGAALPDVVRIARRAFDLAGNDAELRDAAAGMLLFSEAAQKSGEPIHLFYSR